MRKQFFHTITAVALAVFITGCNRDDESTSKPKTPEQETITTESLEGKSPMDLFPSTPGTQVVYELQDPQGSKEVTFQIKGSEDIANGKKITVDVLIDGEKNDTNVWQITDKGLAQVSARNGLIFTPPQTLIHYPIEFSEPRNYAGEGPFAFGTSSGPIEGQVKVRGMEPVNTKIGEIESLAMDAAYRWKDGEATFLSRETIWVAPKFGIVKFNQTVIRQITVEGQPQQTSAQQNLVLKSFSEK